MSQIANGAILAGRAAIAVGFQPQDEPQYFLTYTDDNSVAVQFSRVMDLELSAEGKVVSTPIERGSFASYNKVEDPAAIRATLAVEGELDDLQAVVDTLFELKKNTDKLNFVTPIREYNDFTLEKFSYQQAAEKGVNVLYVEVHLLEIKEVEPQYTDTQAQNPITQKGAKNPADTSTKDMGKGQAQKPAQSKLLKINGGKKIPVSDALKRKVGK